MRLEGGGAAERKLFGKVRGQEGAWSLLSQTLGKGDESLLMMHGDTG